MADIDIVPKRRSTTWMWVLLALIVIAILWVLMMPSDAPPTNTFLDQGPSGTSPAPSSAT